MIKLRNVTHEYSRQRGIIRRKISRFIALKDISLDVFESDFLAITGPNGSGKTTLLKVMSRIIVPTVGEVQVISKNIGFISQKQILLPELTIKENIMLPLIMSDTFDGPEDKDLEDFSEKFKISHILNKHPSECSGGEQQRALLIRALITGSEIILADEPEQNLDSEGKLELYKTLKETNEEYRKTIVLVSQEHVSILKEYAKRILSLKSGEITNLIT